MLADCILILNTNILIILAGVKTAIKKTLLIKENTYKNMVSKSSFQSFKKKLLYYAK